MRVDVCTDTCVGLCRDMCIEMCTDGRMDACPCVPDRHVQEDAVPPEAAPLVELARRVEPVDVLLARARALSRHAAIWWRRAARDRKALVGAAGKGHRPVYARAVGDADGEPMESRYGASGSSFARRERPAGCSRVGTPARPERASRGTHRRRRYLAPTLLKRAGSSWRQHY